MGLELLMGGAAVAGGVAGAVKGLKGTPDQVTQNTSTSQTTFAPASQQELDLQRQSLENYLRQVQLAQQYEGGISGAQGIQDASQRAMLGIIGGQSFQATPEEMANISALRQSMIDQGSADVNNLIDQRLQSLNASAATRGVRGQALSQLQGDAVRAGAEQMGNITRQANQVAAQEMIQSPYRRMQAQQPYISGGASFADQMRLQAQQNRMAAQNPYLLQMLNRERMAGGTTTTTGTNTIKGQEGSWMDAVLGGLGGASGGAQAGANLIRGFSGFGGGGGGFGGAQTAEAFRVQPGYGQTMWA